MNIRDATTRPIRSADRPKKIGERRAERPSAPDRFDPQLHMMAAAVTAARLENARLSEMLRESRDQVRRLSSKVVAVQEEERLRISRELHDEAGQALTALKFSLTAVRDNLSDPQTAGSILEDLSSLTDRTMDQIRQLAHDLRPCVLDRYPLDDVLEGVCSDFARRSRLKIDFESVDSSAITESGRVSFYRFLQEALTNVAKHARASEVRVRLVKKGDYAVLSVSDNGVGFGENGAAGGGAGLVGQKERFELLGGWIEIASKTDPGACIRAGVPLLDQKEPSS